MEYREPQFRVDAIRELMRTEGLSATGFARRAAVSRTLIGAWLSGVVVPQIGTLTRLCRVYKVPITFFFTCGSEGTDASTRDSVDVAQVARARAVI